MDIFSVVSKADLHVHLGSLISINLWHTTSKCTGLIHSRGGLTKPHPGSRQLIEPAHSQIQPETGLCRWQCHAGML